MADKQLDIQFYYLSCYDNINGDIKYYKMSYIEKAVKIREKKEPAFYSLNITNLSSGIGSGGFLPTALRKRTISSKKSILKRTEIGEMENTLWKIIFKPFGRAGEN